MREGKMTSLLKKKKSSLIIQLSKANLSLFISVVHKSSTPFPLTSEIDRITRIINDHPFPEEPLEPTLLRQIPPVSLSPPFVENVLGRLFSAHSNGLKALEFFNYSIHHSQLAPSVDAFEKTLHILTRMRYFDKAWELMMDMKRSHPSLLTLKSMSIMLSKIAKFQSYEDTLEAFKRMETEVFPGKDFGADEFNVMLRAFCSEREMKEARSVFRKMHYRFPTNTKTMNILLLGFKESGDVTAMELFYHEMVRRGFNPNGMTYNIRIDAYCKKGCLGDGLRLLEEMERLHCLPTLETITTLIHGAGVARNIPKARQLFDEIPKRNLHHDTGAYNAMISSLIRSRDINSAIELMEEMDRKQIECDGITYHTMFLGTMKSSGIEGVCELYDKMTERNFVPKTRTVVMLMKFFCENQHLQQGLHLWDYLVQKGQCPHSHALDLLVTGLCSRRRLREAYRCCKQMLERGRHMSERVYQMMQRNLRQYYETDKLMELDRMISKLQSVLPQSAKKETY
ncbi:Pentatricopeptide repeat-containing protein [Hibiscus syriacus]|uniref:Pentatricopeptide repeat-containing protein n=1 Tax=Hibiscus syriacus TaxID=106335 RepID=A0A6A3A2R9_HIBSY|nr:pentatricopeptide repeat-containing protein At3g61360 [Hibiscus syriacus]KAE8698571.1 Pentatricopeptide repeat-containing protein [Hibiscus syriacus]